MPLHNVHIESDLVTGPVVVGVRPCFPIKGVDLTLGNDHGGKVLVKPQVTAVPAVPAVDCSNKLVPEYPTVFSACAVTRAKSKCRAEVIDDVDLSDSFMATELDIPGSDPPSWNEGGKGGKVSLGAVPVASQQMVCDQKADAKLSLLLLEVAESEGVSGPRGYFVKNRVLMHKQTPLFASPGDDWSVVTRVVVPSTYRRDILHLVHNYQLAGHLGINKMYDRVLRHFFRPSLKKDVVRYCNGAFPLHGLACCRLVRGVDGGAV